MVVDCPVRVVGCLPELCRQKQEATSPERNASHDDNLSLRLGREDYTDKVQVFDFDQFRVSSSSSSYSSSSDNAAEKAGVTLENTIPLREWMEHVKPKIQGRDNEFGENADDDDDDNDDDDCPSDLDDDDDVREETLLDLHEGFLPIVRQILSDYQFYQSALRDYQQDDIFIRKYARPNYRHAVDQYATYLHNDAWIAATTTTSSSSTTDGNEYQDIAMVNIWFVLNEQPPTNTLVFWQGDAAHARKSHMLHAQEQYTRGTTVVYDENMSWGRFYLFVAGQCDTSQRILMHGAMNVRADDDDDDDDDDDVTTTNEEEDEQDNPEERLTISDKDRTRRSVEMRYMLSVSTK